MHKEDEWVLCRLPYGEWTATKKRLENFARLREDVAREREAIRKRAKREALIDNVIAWVLCLWTVGFCIALAVKLA